MSHDYHPVTPHVCPPDSDWDCGEDSSQDLEDRLLNTLLITGPTGVGKTAAVYACAQELGFKVRQVVPTTLYSQLPFV